MKRRLVLVIVCLGILALSVLAIGWLFPGHHYFGGLELPLAPEQILERSHNIAVELDYAAAGVPEITLEPDRALIQRIQTGYGVEEANELLKKGVPGYRWVVRWKAGEPDLSGSGGPDEEAHRALRYLRGELAVRLDPLGRVLEISRDVDDTVRIADAGPEVAAAVAERFIRDLAAPKGVDSGDWGRNLTLKSRIRTQFANRIDHVLTWTGPSRLLPDTVDVSMVVAGDGILAYKVAYRVPAQSGWGGDMPIRMLATTLGYALILILMVVVAIRRIKADELGFRLAIGMGVLAAAATFLAIFLTSGQDGLNLVYGLIFGTLVMGGGVVATWAVGESATRETWKDKLIAFDLLSRGHLFHSRVGEGILLGVAGGAAAFAVGLIVQALIEMLMGVWFRVEVDTVREALPVSGTPLAISGFIIIFRLYVFTILIFFLYSWLRGRMNGALALATAAAVGGLLTTGALEPFPAAVLVSIAIVFILLLVFLRGGAMASLIALITVGGIPSVAALLRAGNASYFNDGLSLVALVGTGALLGIAMQFRQKEISDFDSIAPAFGQHISERQRLQNELEVARRVQMSFLPKESPRLPGIELASRCLPAFEVGGDYYDFLSLDRNRLGIVVGDVSGKGTRAAFYMTLAKGFLKALTAKAERPQRVVAEMNTLFYENVERGAFISLIYGVLDISKKSITVARAGHNPLLVIRAGESEVESVQSNGLALGLEYGKKFEKAIEEVTIRLRPGDVAVFYTDGFTEAVNRKGEEFGLDRLKEALGSASHRAAGGILDYAFEAVNRYIGKTRQRDDMTMVVVKIGGGKVRDD